MTFYSLHSIGIEHEFLGEVQKAANSIVHVKDGHRILYRSLIMAPTKVRIADPCRLGTPEI